VKILLSFLLGGLIGSLIIILILSAGALLIRLKYANRVYPKVYLFGKDLAGKTEAEVEKYLIYEQNNLSAQKIIFNSIKAPEKTWEVTPAEINFRINVEKLLGEIFFRGRWQTNLGYLLESYKILIVPKQIEPVYSYDSEKISQFMTKIAADVDLPVKEARFEFVEGRVTDFQVAEEGWAVDQDYLKNEIVNAFSLYPFRESNLDVPLKKLSPKILTSQSNQLGIKELLASGESFFKDSIPTRVHNIILASSKFHGLVIPPGETFSFSANIGEISAATGYQQAYVIKEKKTILEDGGGVCQVSTTLFRAALNAGLPIVERHPHYYRVPFYEQGGYPPGLDATVYPPSPDLKFKNDTEAYILIQTKVDKANKRLVFELYGTSDGRTVKLEKPIIHSTTPPPEPIYVDEPTLPVGVVNRLDTAHPGAKVSFKWQVFAVNGDLKEEKTFWSDYVPWAAVYQRGTKTN